MGKLQKWFAILGVTVEEDKALKTAAMLCTGGKQEPQDRGVKRARKSPEEASSFPPIKGLDSDALPILTIITYLSSVEVILAEGRIHAGFKDPDGDEPDRFAVLRKFKEK